MYQLLKLFFDICLFKKGPQDIPVSNGLLFFLIQIYCSVSFLILYLNTGFVSALLQVAIELIMLLAFCKVVLFVVKKPERYLQTACALIASDTIISFFALPVIMALLSQASAVSFFSIVGLMLLQWNISGFIFSRAIGRPFYFGLGVAFLYILLSYQLMALLFSEVMIG